MKRRRTFAGWVAAAALLAAACMQPGENARVAKSTLVIGVDVSGSFREHYDDAISFAAHYLYGHLNGKGELRVPSAVFVGSVGGGKPGEAKSFQPVHMFQGKSTAEIETTLRELFPPEDSFTDFNSFFDRVATLVKRQGLVLSPINIVILSDGVPDVTNDKKGSQRYEAIDLSPLEYLSRNVTVRLLYASPTISVDWERRVERRRVRMWTVDAPVMQGWHEQIDQNRPAESQDDLWRWVEDNIDFRVRSRRL
jgi:hypothetical protein